VIGGQKWKVILGMLWLAHHNPERVFTKIDLRWDYNNIRIKKGDE